MLLLDYSAVPQVSASNISASAVSSVLHTSGASAHGLPYTHTAAVNPSAYEHAHAPLRQWQPNMSLDAGLRRSSAGAGANNTSARVGASAKSSRKVRGKTKGKAAAGRRGEGSSLGMAKLRATSRAVQLSTGRLNSSSRRVPKSKSQARTQTARLHLH